MSPLRSGSIFAPVFSVAFEVSQPASMDMWFVGDSRGLEGTGTNLLSNMFPVGDVFDVQDCIPTKY